MNRYPQNEIMYHYSVRISDSAGVIKDKNEFSEKEIRVLAENDNRVVLDDEYFTMLTRAKSYSGNQIGKASIGLYNGDAVWGNSVRYDLYSYTKVKASTIKREIEKAIEKKFGFFMRGIDLGVISEAKKVS